MQKYNTLSEELENHDLVQRLRRLGRSNDQIIKDLDHVFIDCNKADRAFERTVLGKHITTPFDYAITTLARLALSNREMPGIYPGLEAMRPFLKTLKVDGKSITSPWPASRFFYEANDFAEVLPFLMETTKLRSLSKASGFEDYLPLDHEEGVEVAGSVPAEFAEQLIFAHKESDGSTISEDLPQRYNHHGTRIVKDGTSIHVLQVLSAKTVGTAATVGTMISVLCRRRIESKKLIVLHRTSIDIRNTIEDNLTPNTSWVAFDSDSPFENVAGWSDKAADTKLLDADDKLFGEMATDFLFHFAINHAVKLSLLPTYFAYQVDMVEEGVLDHSGREIPLVPGKRKPSTQKRPKAFRVIRAVRRPDWSTHAREIQIAVRSDRSWAEPESQVQVQGFWRRLNTGKVGRNHAGDPVIGKTWVTPHVRWKDKPAGTTIPSVKEPLSPYLSANIQGN